MAVKTQGLMELVGNLVFSPVKLVLTPMVTDRDSKGEIRAKGLRVWGVLPEHQRVAPNI